MTPARLIYERLDDDARKLLREIALHADEEPAIERRAEMLEAFNEVLDGVDFYDEQCFRDLIRKDVEIQLLLLERKRPGVEITPAAARRLNRALISAAFPRQISARKQLMIAADKQRRATEADAKNELAELRVKYGAEKP